MNPWGSSGRKDRPAYTWNQLFTTGSDGVRWRETVSIPVSPCDVTSNDRTDTGSVRMQSASQRYPPTGAIMFRVIAMRQRAPASAAKARQVAGSTVWREWSSCRCLASRYLARKRDYSLGPIGKDLSRQFQWRSMVSFEDLWVKIFWSLLRASSRRGMEPHGLRDRP